MVPRQISKDVTTAGTRVQLTTDGFAMTGVIQARVNNVGRVFGGLSDVSSTVYMFALEPGDSITLPPVPHDKDGWDLSAFWLDSANNGDGVKGFYAR